MFAQGVCSLLGPRFLISRTYFGPRPSFWCIVPETEASVWSLGFWSVRGLGRLVDLFANYRLASPFRVICLSVALCGWWLASLYPLTVCARFRCGCRSSWILALIGYWHPGRKWPRFARLRIA
jgi:hypothetical protein